MAMPGMSTQNIAPHKPTLGWALVGAIVLIVGYHFLKKGK